MASHFRLLSSQPIQCDLSFLPSTEQTTEDDDIFDRFVQYNQKLNPCGIDNLILIETHDEIATLLISLINCHVANTTFHVDILPSTLHLFPREEEYLMEERGSDRRALQQSIVVDFTMAIEMYRRDEEEKLNVLSGSGLRGNEIKADILEGTASKHQQIEQCAQKYPSAKAHNKTQIESIMLHLEQEAQFMKIALTALGVFALGLIAAVIWTGLKIIQKKRRRTTRIVDTLPCEIHTERQVQEPSSKVISELSPLRPIKACDETLHFFSPREENIRINHLCDSPQNLYENFFPFRNKDDNVDASSYRHDAPRALFLESEQNTQDVDIKDADKLLVGNSSPTTNIEGQAFEQTERDVTHVLVDSNSKRNTCENPIQSSSFQEHKETHVISKSPFLPHITGINILELADHIETSATPIPFPRHKCAPVIVSPDEITNLTEKIRDQFVLTGEGIGSEDVKVNFTENSASIDVNKVTISEMNPETVKQIPDKFDSSFSNVDEHDAKHEINFAAKSMSDGSLLVSLNADNGYNTIDGIVDMSLAQPSSSGYQTKDVSGSLDDIDPNSQSIDTIEEASKKDTKEKYVNCLKNKINQELKRSSDFKFEQTGAVSDFAYEQAVATGHNTPMPASNDFVEKEHKTPVKAPKRKVLKPVDVSPPPQSNNTEVSEFLSDYW